jgi:hypothetical protein
MRVVIVPPVPALLPAYASLSDPVADLRAACMAAVSWLAPDVEVVADDELGRRVGESLLSASALRDGRFAPSSGTASGPDLLVLANGSGCRTEKAPGHLDERAAEFDHFLGDLLARGDVAGLAGLDVALGAELLATGLVSLTGLAARGLSVETAKVDHDEDPYGVKYWVVRWTCES